MNKSCQTNLIPSCSRAAGLTHRGEAVDVIWLRSGKVCDSSVPREHSLEENATEQAGTEGPYQRTNLKTVKMGLRSRWALEDHTQGCI